MRVLILLFVLAWSLTWGIRRFAITKEILDIPNHRSSHELPTPRGGGLAFVGCFLLSLIFLKTQHLLDTSLFVSFMTAGLLVATLGFLDDRYGMPSHWRLIGHFSAAAIMIYGVQGLPALEIVSWTLPAGTVLNILTLFYLVWLLNLYNFMDGIDGIASLELISVCLSAACLYWFSGALELMALPLLLAVSVGGFFYWNIPPARIFMGDVGSGFLGLMLGVFSMQAARVDEHFFWSWLILLGVFIVDATFTLFHRLYRRCKVYEAHNSHAYQQAARYFGGHLPISLAVLLINICWLFPLAMCVGLGYLESWKGLLIAYAPLVLLAIQFKAGASKDKLMGLKKAKR
ncbi:MAG: glycosyltransferase family 4 protein [Gammaproteobacteria bacterium]|nr:glycosyltransferase family 4 protein [Gammaproteobacteria bacterium]MCH9762693.1 glycosyltransferase family 4 protein [Gammaproteobacteria bacterium]